MGENSIINIPESRVNVWESERPSVVDDLSVASKQRDCGVARVAISVDKDRVPKLSRSVNPRVRSVDSRRREVEAKDSDVVETGISAKQDCERTVTVSRDNRETAGRRGEAEESRQERKRVVKEAREKGSECLKKYRAVTSRSRVFPSSASSSCPRLIQSTFLLFLSLLGAFPFPSSFVSSQQFSSGASRGPALVSGSSFALVSLLAVVLLRPTMAIPTTVASAASDSSASGGTSTSTMDQPLNETIATLARIIQRNRPVVEADDVVRARDDRVRNFAGATTTTTTTARTMPIRRRRDVEDASRQYSDEGDEEMEDDGDREADAFPASVVPRTWESGHEMRSQLREAELDTIRRSIVEGLGLERIPDPSKANVSQTEYRRAHQEYLTRLQHSRDSDDGGRLRRLHTFHPAERNSSVTIVDRMRRSVPNDFDRYDREPPSSEGNFVFYFPISLRDENILVDHANLRLLLDPTDTPIEISKRAISLHRIVNGNSREFVSRQSLSNYVEKGPRWIELDATNLLDNLWQDEDARELGVELIFESPAADWGSSGKQPIVKEPALNVFTTTYRAIGDSQGVRRKRRANPEHLMSIHKGRRTECRGENKKCCRHEMTVTFKDLKGFEFIVQPKNFDAGYCKGRCPPRYNPAHHHALLQSLIWKEDRKKAPRPCCAPSKLDELEILYFDENDPTKLKISSWKNMKVLECACS